MKSRLGRAGVVGAMAIGAVVAVTSLGAPGGAQTDAPASIVNPGVDQSPAVSHDGQMIVFASSVDPREPASSVYIHDRGPLGADGSVLPATTTAIPDSLGAAHPSISGNGCIVTWSVPAETGETDPDLPVPTEPAPVPTDSIPEEQEAPANGSVVPDVSVPTGESVASDATVSAETIASGTVVGDVAAEDTADTEPIDAETSGLQAAPSRIVVLDRCSDVVDARSDLVLRDDDLSFGSAATSFDGSVIAVSNGTDVIRFTRTAAGGYAETGRFDGGDPATADLLVADQVDVSDDGSVVVFSAGPDLSAPTRMTVFAHVADEGDAATSPVLTAATNATVSGDGALVVGSTGADPSSIVLVDRTSVPLAPVDLGAGRRPAISADGNHVAFEDGSNLAIASRTGQGEAPFATTQRTVLSSTVSPTRSGPVIDQFGTTVVSDTDFDIAAPPADTDIAVTAIAADASFDAAMFDLGKGDVGETLAATVTFSNRGPSSIGVESLAVDGTFAIGEDRCGSVIRPGTTCEVDVSFVVERLEDAFGTVTLTPIPFGAVVLTTEVTALGEAPPVSSTSTTTTTTPASTTGGSTGGTTTSTGGTTRGTTTRGTTTTGGSSTSGTRATTTTTVAPGALVSASPAAFDFAPTIIDAGRRTGLVEIVNNGTRAVTVVGVRLDPAESGPFQIVETTCAGESVAAGTRCGVTLSFAPTVTGAQSASLIASIEGGTDITVLVTGTGAAGPIVESIPEVATTGQVITLRGVGFPTGITVDVTWASTVYEVAVDDAGTFSLPVVVMSHTRSGPATLFVAGQDDLFGPVTGTMLVTQTSDRSSPSVIDGVGPNIGG